MLINPLFNALICAGEFDEPMELSPRAPRRALDIIPKHWYNILPDLPSQLPPYLKPSGEPVKPYELTALFPKSLVEQEFATNRFIDIPEELREIYWEIGRPTPLLRAKRLEKYLDTRVRIYFKYEGVLPTGSHKINTALAQAYYNKIEAVERLTTETGAGQWGSALALSGAVFGIKARVYMLKASYHQKPYRRVLMQLYGAEVLLAPAISQKQGKNLVGKPGSPGVSRRSNK